MSNSTLLSVENISLKSQDKNILDNISFHISPKEIITIIGPNGAGKSSLVKVVLGLIKPDEGSISRRSGLRIGYVPQNISLDDTMPMKVGRFLSLAKVSKQDRTDATAFLNIQQLNSQQMHELSGGELQRVLLARAIARKPDILVLDEPLQGVDVTGQIELYRLIASLRDSLNCAILMVSHDLHLVMAQTDSVICLNHHICCQGKPENVSKHPEYLKLFGQKALEDIAVYQHHHDHHHDLHGDAVDCNKGCDHA